MATLLFFKKVQGPIVILTKFKVTVTFHIGQGLSVNHIGLTFQ